MASSSIKVSTDSPGTGLLSLSSKASQDWRSADRRTDSAGRAGLYLVENALRFAFVRSIIPLSCCSHC